MKFFRRIIHSFISFFNMSSDPSLLDRSDPHRIWYIYTGNSTPVADYLCALIDHISFSGAIVGPDDWYVSEVATYKSKKGLRHELLMATIQQSPRVPRQNAGHSSDGRPDGISAVPRQTQPANISGHQPSFLVIERSMDRAQNKEGASQSGDSSRHPHENANDVDTPSSSDSLKESLHMKNYTVKFLSGRRPALDEVSHRLSNNNGGNHDLIGRMVLPEPPTLPAEDDFHVIFKQLSATDPPEVASSSSSSSHTPTATPSSPSPHFISVPALICLARAISECERLYSFTETNCYWYSSLLFYSIRRYTGANIIVQGREAQIGPEESPDNVKKAFNEAGLEPGHFSGIDVVQPPSNENIDLILSRWAARRANMEVDYRYGRFNEIKRMMEADKAAKDKVKAEDRERQALKDKAEAEDRERQALKDKAEAEERERQALKDKAEAEERERQALKDKTEAEERERQMSKRIEELLAAQAIDPQHD